MTRLIVDTPVFLRLAPLFGLVGARLSQACGINLLSWGRPGNIKVAKPVLGGMKPLSLLKSPSGSKWSARAVGGTAIAQSDRVCLGPDGSLPVNPAVPEFAESYAWGARTHTSRTGG